MADKKELAARLDDLETKLARIERRLGGVSTDPRTGADEVEGRGPAYCAVPEVPEREFGPEVSPGRAELIRVTSKKWVNGTQLHYYFFDKDTDGQYVYFRNGTRQWRTWTADNSQKDAVRRAFKTWKEVGIGLEFQEVNAREEAEIRIGFMRGDGSWSYVGRDVLDQGSDERTMNLGWDLTRDNDTAVHEIGHTLGFPHEHQNPNAGIVWDEEAVYTSLAAPPNNWSRQKTYYNIIRKIDPDTVQGSNWDPDSIMHYPFEAGLIKEPAQYRGGLDPAAGLSERDKTQVKFFYPPLDPTYPELRPYQAQRLNIGAGEQKDFSIVPGETRRYTIRTFGESDTVMVLFEDDSGRLRYLTADDDSGTDYNANIRVKLYSGRRYVLRIRLYYRFASGSTAVMLW